jgi:hypothetical protein
MQKLVAKKRYTKLAEARKLFLTRRSRQPQLSQNVEVALPSNKRYKNALVPRQGFVSYEFTGGAGWILT